MLSHCVGFSMVLLYGSYTYSLMLNWEEYRGILVVTCLFGFVDSCRGYKRFFKRTALEASDYLKDDCLSVHCSVGVVRSHTEGPKIYSITVPPSNIGQHFGKLLESGKGTDVNFEVDDEVFSAHKLVLAARSPVFRAQLFGPMKDQDTKCIKVQDVEGPAFKVSSSNPCLSFFVTLFIQCFIVYSVLSCTFLSELTEVAKVFSRYACYLLHDANSFITKHKMQNHLNILFIPQIILCSC